MAVKAKSPLTWDERWAAYHLVNGGISAKATIEHALGRPLDRAMLNAALAECDQTTATPRELSSPVWCGYCNALTSYVPCKTCQAQGRGDNFRQQPVRRNRDYVAELVTE